MQSILMIAIIVAIPISLFLGIRALIREIKK